MHRAGWRQREAAAAGRASRRARARSLPARGFHGNVRGALRVFGAPGAYLGAGFPLPPRNPDTTIVLIGSAANAMHALSRNANSSALSRSRFSGVGDILADVSLGGRSALSGGAGVYSAPFRAWGLLPSPHASAASLARGGGFLPPLAQASASSSASATQLAVGVGLVDGSSSRTQPAPAGAGGGLAATVASTLSAASSSCVGATGGSAAGVAGRGRAPAPGSPPTSTPRPPRHTNLLRAPTASHTAPPRRLNR